MATSQKSTQKSYPTLTASLAVSLAKRLASLESVEDSTILEALYFLSLHVLSGKNNHAFVCLRTSRAYYRTGGGSTFRVILTTLDELGYDVQWQVLNSKDHGVPQNRERIIIVGHLRGTPQPKVFPITGNSSQNLKKLIDGPQANRVYDPSGLAVNQVGLGGGLGAKTGLYAVDMTRREPKGYKVRKDGNASAITANYYKGMCNQERPAVAVPVITPDRVNKKQNGRQFKDDGEPSFTLTSQDKHGIFDGCKIRRLTPLECERLQAFPDNWTKEGSVLCDGKLCDRGKWGGCLGHIVDISDTQRYKMCGNAVTTNVIQAVFERIFSDDATLSKQGI